MDLEYLRLDLSENRHGSSSKVIFNFNELLDEIYDVGSFSNQLIPIRGGSVGNFSNFDDAKTYLAAFYLNAESAIKLVFPPNANTIISKWALTFDNPNTTQCMRLESAIHFQKMIFTGNWSGFFPSDFGINWFTNVAFADGEYLNSAADNKLNVSLKLAGFAKEFHIYNKYDFGFGAVIDFSFGGF